MSVVVPTLNERERLPALLADLRQLTVPMEILVVDGGSRDGTAAVARAAGARVVLSQPGRGCQLRTGARYARGQWLFFVHADTRIPEAARCALEAFLAEPPGSPVPTFAHFGFRLRGRHWFWRFVEFGQRIRVRATGLVYGDQGLVVERTVYEAAGGYPDWPIMEDVGVIDRLRKHARRVPLAAPLITSPRRYQDEGHWSGLARNVALVTLFRLGASPERLARWYRPHTPDPPRSSTPSRTLLFFAKAPRPGTVKTRLAADIGQTEAVLAYRRMGRGVVDALRNGPYRSVVCYDPPDGEEEIAEWLSREELVFHPQVGGDLGTRMSDALAWALESADEACVVGLDVPDLAQTHIQEAFRALEDRDVVVGPAADGGYYLLAVTEAYPDLFRDIPWGSSRVLAETLARADELGLSVLLLPELRDVDTGADLLADLQG